MPSECAELLLAFDLDRTMIQAACTRSRPGNELGPQRRSHGSLADILPHHTLLEYVTLFLVCLARARPISPFESMSFLGLGRRRMEILRAGPDFDRLTRAAISLD